MITVIVGLIAIVLEVIAVMWLWPLPEGNPMKLHRVPRRARHREPVPRGRADARRCRRTMRRPAPAVITLLFGFSFFIPILGLIGMIVGAFVSKFLPRLVPELPYAEIPPIEFEFPPREIRERTKYGQGGLTSRLKDAGVPKETRFKSLLALQGMPAEDREPAAAGHARRSGRRSAPRRLRHPRQPGKEHQPAHPRRDREAARRPIRRR